MTAERWQKVEAIVQSALDIKSDAERDGFVSNRCSGDEELRREVFVRDSKRQSFDFADCRFVPIAQFGERRRIGFPEHINADKQAFIGQRSAGI